MLEISRLVNSLSGGEGRGIDTLDPRFQDIATLVEQADYAGAAAKCEETFGDGADVRLVAWYLFGLFLQDGVKGLAPLLTAAAGMFRDHFAAIGPEKKKDLHSTAGMGWFLGKIADRVTGDEPEKAAEHTRLRNGSNLEEAAAALQAIDQLAEAFAAAIPANPPKVTDQVRRVRDWLTRLQVELTPEPEPEPVAVEAPPPAEAPSGGAPSSEGSDQGGPRPSFSSGAPVVEASFRMVELQARIAAFESLMARGDVAKAALIANDVMQVIEHFDPRLYLPRLFSGFFNQFSRRTIDLLGFQEKKDSAAWKVFEHLYRSDLDAFVRCKDEDFQRQLAGSSPGAAPSAAPPPDNGGGGGNGDSWGQPAPAAVNSNVDW